MNIYSIKIFFNNKTIILKCSYKLLPLSLNKIATGFKIIEKKIFPYKFAKYENLNYIGEIPNIKYFNNDDEYYFFLKNNIKFNFKQYSINYCHNDVYITKTFISILYSMVKEFKFSLDKIYSASSLSFNIYKKHFNIKKIKFSYNVLENKLVRPSYYGGRCEIYGNPIDNEYLYHYDFSGMYGLCMNQKFCYGKYKINKAVDINKAGFYWIKYESNMQYPVLPHHNQINGKLMFTNGELSGCYWYEEIIKFIEMGGKVTKIINHISYPEYDYIFNDFISYFNKIREKKGPYKIFAKLIINSLYGRLGMNIIDTHTFFDKFENISYYFNNYNVLSYKEINDMVLLKIEINKNIAKKLNIVWNKTQNNINVASAITSKARIKLYEAQQSVINNGGRLLYSDTDSIFAAYSKNVDNEKHGEIFWDISKEDTLIKDAVFIAPKSYGIKYKNNKEVIKMKGYNQKNILFNSLKEQFYEEKNHIKIKKYSYIEKKNFNLSEKIIEKNFNINNYDKRKFVSNKKNTVPYTYIDYLYI